MFLVSCSSNEKPTLKQFVRSKYLPDQIVKIDDNNYILEYKPQLTYFTINPRDPVKVSGIRLCSIKFYLKDDYILNHTNKQSTCTEFNLHHPKDYAMHYRLMIQKKEGQKLRKGMIYYNII
jgi:hypothetical protein